MSEQRFLLDWDMKTILKDKKPMLPYDVVVCLNEQQATIDRLKNAIRIAYEEKPYPTIDDIKAKYKELDDE